MSLFNENKFKNELKSSQLLLPSEQRNEFYQPNSLGNQQDGNNQRVWKSQNSQLMKQTMDHYQKQPDHNCKFVPGMYRQEFKFEYAQQPKKEVSYISKNIRGEMDGSFGNPIIPQPSGRKSQSVFDQQEVMRKSQIKTFNEQHRNSIDRGDASTHVSKGRRHFEMADNIGNLFSNK